MTCNDTGYQAIEFDAETHIPKVNNMFNHEIKNMITKYIRVCNYPF